ncbi:MAG: TMEM165/GDT1 family protein [Cyanobacteria bacterium P01_A01_bin.105]
MTDSTLDSSSATADEAVAAGTTAESAVRSDSGPDSGPNSEKTNFWGVFSSTFLTIFLAELGDKTQVTTLMMSAESQSPWTVFIGAALALISTSLIGVLLGQWLSTRVSPRTLDTLAAVVLLVITITLVADVMGV